VQKNFGAFYDNLFTHQWNKENQDISFLEYAWDVSPQNFMKCDPCVATAPSEQDIVQAGVWWLHKDWSDYSDVEEEEEDLSRNVHFTRLHFRYNRNHFAQDLMFQVTPNKENFQARYVITHPATGNLSCDAGKKYLLDLKKRRKAELNELTALTGKDIETWQDMAATNEEAEVKEAQYAGMIDTAKEERQSGNRSFAGFILLGAAVLGTGVFVRSKGMA
jgi:hypothetical protein